LLKRLRPPFHRQCNSKMATVRIQKKNHFVTVIVPTISFLCLRLSVEFFWFWLCVTMKLKIL